MCTPRYWMYGEVVERAGVQLNQAESRGLRGWFPRSCCTREGIIEEAKEE